MFNDVSLDEPLPTFVGLTPTVSPPASTPDVLHLAGTGVKGRLIDNWNFAYHDETNLPTTNEKLQPSQPSDILLNLQLGQINSDYLSQDDVIQTDWQHHL